MKELFILTIICITFGSCSNTMMVAGKYLGNEMDLSLELNADSTYYYLYRYEMPISESKGKWKVIGNNLIELNEYYDLENLPISVNENHLEELHSTQFNINIPGLVAADCCAFGLLLDGNELIKKRGHIIKIPSSKTDFTSFSIRIFFGNDTCYIASAQRTGIMTSSYQRKSKESNYFEITVPFEEYMLNGITIRNDTLIVDGDEIFWNKIGKFEKIHN